MSEKAPSKDEALEALDFIVNVLKEHEKDLDRLVSELGTVADQLGENGEINGKVKKIEDKITGLQNEVGNLVKSMSRPEFSSQPIAFDSPKATANDAPTIALPSSLPLVMQCAQWEDFQNLAKGAQTLSFSFKEAEKSLQINALKNNQIISFDGEMPTLVALLKVYLNKQTGVPERQILEGTISLK